MTGRHLKNFNLAIQASLKSCLTEKHGAVAISGGKVIGAGCNSNEQLRIFNGCDAFGCFLHAELAALSEIRALQNKTVRTIKVGKKVQRVLLKSHRSLRSTNKGNRKRVVLY